MNNENFVKIGTRVIWLEDEYIISRVSLTEAAMINVKNGNRFREPVKLILEEQKNFIVSKDKIFKFFQMDKLKILQ